MSQLNTQQPNSNLESLTDEDDFPEVELETESVLNIGAGAIEVLTDDAPEEAPTEDVAVDDAPEEEESAEEATAPASITKEQFDTFLQENYGISGDVFKAGLSFVAESQEAIVNFTYAQAWGVDIVEASNRIDKVLAYIDTLPEAEQKRYQEEGTAEDTMKLWDTIEKTQRAKRQVIKAKGVPPSQQSRPKPSFTSAEIDAMSDDEYSKKQHIIAQAYREGRVK